MGEFFGSIHICGVERDDIMSACTQIAGKFQCQFLVTPAVGLWTVLYPSDHGQNEAVSRELAQVLRGRLLHVILHDGDVFCYHYFKNGQPADQYCSDPDYFGTEPTTVHRQLRGNPDAFSDLLVDAERVELRRLLATASAGDDDSAGIGFVRFAALLGLSHAATSYEYLTLSDGERPRGVSLTHVPPLDGEIKKEKRAQSALARLKREGLLLHAASPAPVEVRAYGDSGFLVTPPQPRPDGWPSLGRWESPWKSPAVDAGVDIGDFAHLCVSPSGRYLATGRHLWDLEECRLVVQVSTDYSWDSTFLDDDTLMTWGPGSSEFYIVTASTGAKRIVAMNLPYVGREAAIHRQDRILLVPHHEDGIWLVEIATGRALKRLFLRPEDSGVPLWMPQRILGGREQLQALAPTAASDIVKFLTAPSIYGARPRPEPVMRMQVSSDGRSLFCATGRDLRVFDWQSILEDTDGAPAPRHRFDFAAEDELRNPVDPDTLTFATLLLQGSVRVLALEEDTQRKVLLFATTKGEIAELDLATGRKRTLLTLPDEGPIAAMGLSNDRRTLYTFVNPKLALVARARRRQPRLCLWNYDELLRAAL